VRAAGSAQGRGQVAAAAAAAEARQILRWGGGGWGGLVIPLVPDLLATPLVYSRLPRVCDRPLVAPRMHLCKDAATQIYGCLPRLLHERSGAASGLEKRLAATRERVQKHLAHSSPYLVNEAWDRWQSARRYRHRTDTPIAWHVCCAAPPPCRAGHPCELSPPTALPLLTRRLRNSCLEAWDGLEAQLPAAYSGAVQLTPSPPDLARLFKAAGV
jgi:hypothetical protein